MEKECGKCGAVSVGLNSGHPAKLAEPKIRQGGHSI